MEKVNQQKQQADKKQSEGISLHQGAAEKLSDFASPSMPGRANNYIRNHPGSQQITQLHSLIDHSSRVQKGANIQSSIHKSQVVQKLAAVHQGISSSHYMATQYKRQEDLFGGAALQRKEEGEEEPVQKKESAVAPRKEGQQEQKNTTGMPDPLKAGIEHLSGMGMDDVKVHYNSSQPMQLQAHAYAQGTDIHIGPGQEKHLPHEAWHVVQQKQGRVQPTIQTKGIAVNDDSALEKEADEMGRRSLNFNMDSDKQGQRTASWTPASSSEVVQGYFTYKGKMLDNAESILEHEKVRGNLTKKQLEDFNRINQNNKPVSLSAWLQQRKIRLNLQEALAELQSSSDSQELSESSENEEEMEQEQDGIVMKELLNTDFLIPEEKQEDDPDWKEGDELTEADLTRKRKMEREEDESEEEYEEEEDIELELSEEAIEAIDMNVPLFLVVTWNMEKYGRSLKPEKKAIKALKRKALLRIVDVFHPTAIVMQEVTNGELLMEGNTNTKGELVEEGLKHADLHETTRDHMIKKKKMDADEAKGLDNVFGNKEYPLSNEYGMLPGPAFHTLSYNNEDEDEHDPVSGYKENYSLLFDKGTVKGTPVAYTFNPESDELEEFEKDDEPIEFGLSKEKREKKKQQRRKNAKKNGKKKKEEYSDSEEEEETPDLEGLRGLDEDTTRRLVVWEMEVTNQRYPFRPEAVQYDFGVNQNPSKFSDIKVQQAERDIKTTQILIGVVHTSPSMSISQEVTAILNNAQKIADEKGLPMLIGGDWYMEKDSKRNWNKLSKPKDDNSWQLLIPQNQTNFPSKKTAKGQKADHFVSKRKDFKEQNTKALLPPQHLPLSMEQHSDKPEDSQLKEWRNIHADHAPVMTVVELVCDGKKIKTKKGKKK